MPKIPLPENQGFLLQPSYDAQAFNRDAIACFPELKEDLEYFADLLHVQIGTLAGSVRSALEGGDSNLAIRIFAFLEKALTQPEPTKEMAEFWVGKLGEQLVLTSNIASNYEQDYFTEADFLGVAGDSELPVADTLLYLDAGEDGVLKSFGHSGPGIKCI
jgi:hypothetical protein